MQIVMNEKKNKKKEAKNYVKFKWHAKLSGRRVNTIPWHIWLQPIVSRDRKILMLPFTPEKCLMLN